MATFSQMELQALQWMDVQEKELQRLSALLVEHQAILQFLPERTHQEHPQAPPENFSQLRQESLDYLPSTINVNRGAASRTGKLPDLNETPGIEKDTFEDILTDAEVPATHQRWV